MSDDVGSDTERQRTEIEEALRRSRMKRRETNRRYYLKSKNSNKRAKSVGFDSHSIQHGSSSSNDPDIYKEEQYHTDSLSLNNQYEYEESINDIYQNTPDAPSPANEYEIFSNNHQMHSRCMDGNNVEGPEAPDMNMVYELLVDMNKNNMAQQAHILELTSKIEYLTDRVNFLSQKITENPIETYRRENVAKEILFDGKNLLDINKSSMSQYITKLMEILFTAEELAKGYIKEPNSISKREALDLDRVQILKDAVMTKYRISDSTKDIKWKEVKEIANRKCRDMDKKVNANTSNFNHSTECFNSNGSALM